MASPERVQVTATPDDTQRIRNTVTCGESCLISPYYGNQKAAVMFIADSLPRIPCRWELDEEMQTLMVYPV